LNVDYALEPASVSLARKVFAVAVLVALASAVAQAQPPIRIGASIAHTGSNAVPGASQLRGYQLCVKHMNEKGGVLGRKLELLFYDDGSERTTAARLYEKLIAHDKVDLVLGPFGSGSTDAAANVTDRHRMPMVAPTAADPFIYKKGRKFIFSMQPSAEVILEGLVDLAAKKGLKTVALINLDSSFPRAITQGAIDLAKKKGLQVVFVDAYPAGTTDFSAILTKVRAANPDVLGGATIFEDAVAITRQMKALNVNPRMTGLTVGVDLPTFYETLGRDAEFVYGTTGWLPELVDLRAGGLIPIARQYPGAREFAESYRKEFSGADLSNFSAAGYGGCQILVEAIRRAGSLNSGKLREALSKMDHNTVFGAFRVDRDGRQIGHKILLFQWQDGKKAIVWPEELASVQPRFPTLPWNQRP
jgi:branched-chain amino acid transport system substrate-binding protein